MKNRQQNRSRINNAILVLADPNKQDNLQIIEQSIVTLIEAQNWAKTYNFVKNENEALWGLYLCYSKTNRPQQAIEALQSLRHNLEYARSQIHDEYRRAGMMKDFPRLFSALCQLLYENKCFSELLDAIEGAKGRVLADILTKKQGQIVSDQTFSEPTKQLPELMQQVNAHYISYFVDNETIYAVLVAKNGSIYATKIPTFIEELKKDLKQYTKAGDFNPKNWGFSKSGYFGTPPNSANHLSLLVEWLEPIANAGLIEQDDHICYCPDGEIHLLPLHYVSFLGKTLVDYVSISRIQSVFALITILKQKPARPKQFIALQVPTQKELDKKEKLSNLGRAPDWLAQNLSGKTLYNEEGDINKLTEFDLQQKVVHFATHGTFPKEVVEGYKEGERIANRNPNPYYVSGLLLARNGQLPSDDIFSNGKTDSLLTPDKVLNLNFLKSHVTLQACVSGLAKEGIGGDALGLEWTLFQAGVQSLLATHWDVRAKASADFSIYFYEQWLVEKNSRAESWRKAVLKVMETPYGNDRPPPYYWAGFSLSGDWR